MTTPSVVTFVTFVEPTGAQEMQTRWLSFGNLFQCEDPIYRMSVYWSKRWLINHEAYGGRCALGPFSPILAHLQPTIHIRN